MSFTFFSCKLSSRALLLHPLPPPTPTIITHNHIRRTPRAHHVAVLSPSDVVLIIFIIIVLLWLVKLQPKPPSKFTTRNGKKGPPAGARSKEKYNEWCPPAIRKGKCIFISLFISGNFYEAYVPKIQIDSPDARGPEFLSVIRNRNRNHPEWPPFVRQLFFFPPSFLSHRYPNYHHSSLWKTIKPNWTITQECFFLSFSSRERWKVAFLIRHGLLRLRFADFRKTKPFPAAVEKKWHLREGFSHCRIGAACFNIN